jgi:primase-polymerase (primpol)-like protein
MGFVLNGDGISCVDLDHCIVDGVLAPWAQRIVDRAPGCYVERSPSGDGLHIWGYASVPQGRVVSTPGGGKAEVYGWGRYLTVTSRPWGDTPSRLGDLTGLVSELIA